VHTTAFISIPLASCFDSIIFGIICRYSRYPEGEFLGLLRLEDVVPVQISNAPYDDNYEERYEARTVVYYLGKGKYYRYPIDNIVCHKGQVEWVSEPQFGWNGVG
jgi:hypothetical protein